MDSGHGPLKQAFVVLTILFVLTILLLSVGMVRAAPSDRGLSIDISGLVVGSTVGTEGNKKGTSFSGRTATLYLAGGLELAHFSPVDDGDFTLDGVEYTMGDSGFGGGTLFLGFNIYHPQKYWNGAGIPKKDDFREVFRLQIFLDVGRDKGPACYEDSNARVDQVHIVWQWQERGRPGSGKGHWVLIDEDIEDHPRSIPHSGYIAVSIASPTAPPTACPPVE